MISKILKFFKSFSQSLEQFFLTVCQNNFGNKIPFLIACLQASRAVQLVVGDWGPRLRSMGPASNQLARQIPEAVTDKQPRPSGWPGGCRADRAWYWGRQPRWPPPHGMWSLKLDHRTRQHFLTFGYSNSYILIR